jgi:hypothetical protein
MGPDQPLDTVERFRGLLAARQCEGDVAARREPFHPISNQAVRKDRRHGLIIGGAAGIKPAILLDQLERIAYPVLALRFDDINVGQEENRLRLAVLPA